MSRGRNPMIKAERDAASPRYTDSAIPDCPDWLGEKARAEWARVAPLLADMGLLARVDQAALASYCHCYGEVQDATIQMQREGLVQPGSMDQPRVHPLGVYIEKNMSKMLSFMTEFGFTPASRGRMDLSQLGRDSDPAERERDELSDFIGT